MTTPDDAERRAFYQFLASAAAFARRTAPASWRGASGPVGYVVNETMPGELRQRFTPVGGGFDRHLRNTAAKVDRWPEWKRANSGLGGADDPA